MVLSSCLTCLFPPSFANSCFELLLLVPFPLSFAVPILRGLVQDLDATATETPYLGSPGSHNRPPVSTGIDTIPYTTLALTPQQPSWPTRKPPLFIRLIMAILPTSAIEINTGF